VDEDPAGLVIDVDQIVKCRPRRLRGASSSSFTLEQDLAEMLAAFHRRIASRASASRKRLVHERRDLSLCSQLEQFSTSTGYR